MVGMCHLVTSVFGDSVNGGKWGGSAKIGWVSQCM